ncbi:VWA domain-containing protein [uncultured Thiohalocapsa sp.]|uniref:VWA domain-containing protein n=1 Tax=uncultured Thiohalocapsa sp. TaxID=768990 RepID=UPI0025F2BFC6|nr:VWA domain-containing protein [uncultured Thiohalocapsa sp.]
MTRSRKDLERPSSDGEIDAFLQQVARTPPRARAGPRGRLIFAMDATASREPTWDRAADIQVAMFHETRDLGGLEVQLCHYGGFREFHASPWCASADALLPRMTRVRCNAGLTQIARVLAHAKAEAGRKSVNALVFVGDCVEEDHDRLAGAAGELGLLGVPVFVFQEGREPQAERVLKDIARLSGGAWCPFDHRSPQALKDLLSAVAVFAAGGRKALTDFGRRRGGAVLQLTHQLEKR